MGRVVAGSKGGDAPAPNAGCDATHATPQAHPATAPPASRAPRAKPTRAAAPQRATAPANRTAGGAGSSAAHGKSSRATAAVHRATVRSRNGAMSSNKGVDENDLEATSSLDEETVSSLDEDVAAAMERGAAANTRAGGGGGAASDGRQEEGGRHCTGVAKGGPSGSVRARRMLGE